MVLGYKDTSTLAKGLRNFQQLNEESEDSVAISIQRKEKKILKALLRVKMIPRKKNFDPGKTM